MALFAESRPFPLGLATGRTGIGRNRVFWDFQGFFISFDGPLKVSAAVVSLSHEDVQFRKGRTTGRLQIPELFQRLIDHLQTDEQPAVKKAQDAIFRSLSEIIQIKAQNFIGAGQGKIERFQSLQKNRIPGRFQSFYPDLAGLIRGTQALQNISQGDIGRIKFPVFADDFPQSFFRLFKISLLSQFLRKPVFQTQQDPFFD
jgi:hypothetical protein